MNLFTVPTLTGVLYYFLVMGHDRGKVLRSRVTRNPSALWIAAADAGGVAVRGKVINPGISVLFLTLATLFG
jgi:hypothetical protein